MIPKSGYRFLEKIMLQQWSRARWRFGESHIALTVRGPIDAGQDGDFELSWLGGFGHSVCASTDFPSCCTVSAADWPSPPASGRMALRSTGCCFGGSSPLLAPVVALPADDDAAPGGHGFGTCAQPAVERNVISAASRNSFVMTGSFCVIATNAARLE